MAQFDNTDRVVVEADNDTFSSVGNGQRIARDALGRLWVMTRKSTGGSQYYLSVQYSDDQGQSWSTPELVVNQVDSNGAGNSILGIFIDNDGKPVISAEYQTTKNIQRFYRREGNDVTPAWTYLSGADIDWQVVNSFDRSNQNFIQDRITGEWHILFIEGTTNNKKVRHKVSTDNLASWGAANDVASSSFELRQFNNQNAAALWFDAAGDLFHGSVDNWVGSSASTLRVFRWNGVSWSRHDSGDTHPAGSSGFSGADFCLSPDGTLIVAAIGNGNPGETLDVYTSPAAGGAWTNRTISPTIRTATPRLNSSADGRVHLVALQHTADQIHYYYSDDQGATWSAEENVHTGLTLTCNVFMIKNESSLHLPESGTALLVYDYDASSEAWYLASVDLTWPVIAVGLRCTRIILRALGSPADPILPLALPTDLPPLLTNNWEPGVEIDTTFQVDVTESFDSVAEERRALMDRPYRSMRALITGLKQAEAYRILNLIARHGSGRNVVPLYSDHSKVTASSSGTTIYCETRWRRFSKGARVVIFDWDGYTPTNVEYRLVSKISADRLTLTVALSSTHAAGARVMPTMDCETNLGMSQDLLSDGLSNLNLSSIEVIGYSALPSLTTGDPPDFDLYNDLPILDIIPNWRDSQRVGFDRDGEVVNVGKGRFVELYGSRPRAVYDLSFSFHSRREAWRLLRFLESRRGRVRSFWLPGAQTLWRIVAIDEAYVDVKPDGDIDDLQEFYTYVAIVRKSGQVEVRTIDSVTDNTTSWRLGFDIDIQTVTLADVRRVTSGHLMRLNRDSHTEKWITDEIVDVTVQAIDLLQEQDVEIV